MKEINIIDIVKSRYPNFLNNYPNIIKKIIYILIEKILYLNEINKFLKLHSNRKSFDFIEELFDYLDFSYMISDKDKQKIPIEGRLIVVSNHPLGSLDGLALLKSISQIRPDTKIIANDILEYITPLKDLIIPFNIESFKIQKENILKIEESLKKEECLIFFPAAEVSRLRYNGIKDSKWNKGPIYFAKKLNSPILPVFIKGRNTLLFYLISIISKSFSKLLLPREMFKQKGKTIEIKVGDFIPNRAFNSDIIDIKTELKLLKKHVYRLGSNKKLIFVTEKNIISPVEKSILKKEIKNAKLIGKTKNGFNIYITQYENTPLIIREIARLREITFRKIGEGTGNKADFDLFDNYYHHIFLWDENSEEIIGSYRIGVCEEILNKYGIKGLYSNTLFEFSNDFTNKYFYNSIELGRSFIQPKHWNSNALDYLWMGIGSFLFLNPNIKYMFGPVSLSNSLSPEVKNMIIYFYSKWFGIKNNNDVISKNKYILSEKSITELSSIFSINDYASEFKTLKTLVKTFGYSIPPLFKQYSELCNDNGTKFYDFNIDPNFNNCVDGFILVEIDKIKNEKKERYIYNNKVCNVKKVAENY